MPYNGHNLNHDIHIAVKSGDIHQCLRLLAQGADINSRTTKGSTPLHIATKNKDWIMMSFLIHNGAPINTSDSMGHTALHIAALRSLVEAIAILIRYGCDEGKRDLNGKTALDYAIDSQGADSVTLLRLARLGKSERIEDFNSTLMEALNEIQINFDNRPTSTSKSITDVGAYNTDTLSLPDHSAGSGGTLASSAKPKLRKLPRSRLNADSILFKYEDLLTRMSSALSHEELANFEEIVRSKIIDQTILESCPEAEPHPLINLPNLPIPSNLQDQQEITTAHLLLLQNSAGTSAEEDTYYGDRSDYSTGSGYLYSSSPQQQRSPGSGGGSNPDKKSQKSKTSNSANNNLNILRHATSYRYMAKNAPLINNGGGPTASRKEKKNENNLFRANSEKY